MRNILLGLLACLSSAAWCQHELLGTWELIYVAPTDAMDSNPQGISNIKLHFTPDGKVTYIKPDQKLTDGNERYDYKFDGKRLTLLRNANRLTEVTVTFPDDDNMVFTAMYASLRRFKRIAGPDVELEPRSLQLLKTDAPASEVSYDKRSYAAEPAAKRLTGAWEITEFRNVPRNQLPPYGFFNDVWVIDKGKLTVTLRHNQSSKTIPYALEGDQLLVTDAVIGQPSNRKLAWRYSFDKWGHLVLDGQGLQIVLTLLGKDTSNVALPPLKVVLATTPGQ